MLFPITGQIISTVKEACRKAFQNQSQRLVTPMYACNIVCSADVLGEWKLFFLLFCYVNSKQENFGYEFFMRQFKTSALQKSNHFYQ